MPINNQERRNHAEQAVRAYLKSKGEPSPEQIEETEIADLIADLHHLAQIDGFDIERIDRLAAMHYEAEQADEIEQARGQQ
jgi:hypothetical protein